MKKSISIYIKIIFLTVFIIILSNCYTYTPLTSTPTRRDPIILFERLYNNIDLYTTPNIFNDLVNRYGNEYLFYDLEIIILDINYYQRRRR